jgi:hypothetical protein
MVGTHYRALLLSSRPRTPTNTPTKIASSYMGISTNKIVPVPAVPEPNSPDDVIPEYPSRGDFLAGSNLYTKDHPPHSA